MDSTSISCASLFCKIFTPILPEAKPAYSLKANLLPTVRYSPFIAHSLKASSNGNCSYRTSQPVVVACGAKESGSREEERAVETVLKLYEAMKNRNVYELSDIIAEECSCISNFVSTFQPFHGKKQVLAFITSLMKNLGNNIQFVVQNTKEDGMIVVVSWKLEWNNIPLPLGKGFSFYMCHVYQGKVMIKNLEIFMEPLLHIEPLRLKVISVMMNAMEKLNPLALFKDNERRATKILFVLLFMAAALFFLKHWLPAR